MMPLRSSSFAGVHASSDVRALAFSPARDGKTCTLKSGAVRALLASAAAATLALSSPFEGVARADDNTIKSPGDHPTYVAEIEPHLTLGFDNIYASSGIGVGGRFSFPIVQNGFVPSINNSVAIGVGVDLLHYSGCYGRNTINCSANYLFIPVVMQWNFFVARRWSVFGEPGLAIFNGFFDDCADNTLRFCENAPKFGWRPAFFAGGRYHFSEHVALTMRIGYPSFSVGVSFM